LQNNRLQRERRSPGGVLASQRSTAKYFSEVEKGEWLQVPMGGHDEDLGRFSARVAPTMMDIRRNAGGIPSFEAVRVFFQCQFDGTLKHDCQLFRAPYIRT
jgi:hypothetical protein